MLQPELLIKAVIQALEDAGIEYMVTGSVVSSLQGEPRSTHDVDLVVSLRKSAVGKLLEAFPPPDFYLSENSINSPPPRSIGLDLAIQTERKSRLPRWIWQSNGSICGVQSILDAIETRSMFNLIDVKGGDKVDFWLLTDEPFDQTRFSRKSAVETMGISMYVSTPEDTILAKLRWAELSGGSEKQFGDALRVYDGFMKFNLKRLTSTI